MIADTRFSLLHRLINSASPSGFEQPVQKVIREEVQLSTRDVQTDSHGNVIATLNRGGTPRVMLSAHCDEVGFMAHYIDDNGYIYFGAIGGLDPAILSGERIQFHTPQGSVAGVIGHRPLHSLGRDERDRTPHLDELWIDIGVESQEEASKLVPIGSTATRIATLDLLRENLIISRALDDKSGIFAAIEALRRLAEQKDQLKAEVCFVSTVQEEIGLRGAITGTYRVNPDIAIAVDVIPSTDYPHSSKQKMGEIKINGGPVITIGAFTNPQVSQLLIAAAQSEKLAYQICARPSDTSTDIDMIQITRGSVATGLVSIPCRYLHTGSEIASLKDIDEVATVLTHFVLGLSEHTNLIPS
jgi:putative aminopeptidase FrvX